jgi:hypothetical protein
MNQPVGLAAFEPFLPGGRAACGFYPNKSPKNAKRRASNPTFQVKTNDSTIPTSDSNRQARH